MKIDIKIWYSPNCSLCDSAHLFKYGFDVTSKMKKSLSIILDVVYEYIPVHSFHVYRIL